VGLALWPFFVLLLLPARLSWFVLGERLSGMVGGVGILLTRDAVAVGRLVRTGCGSIPCALFIR
jgi:hypothetical protein